jgi:protein-tyrosine-phosphatase
VDPDEDIVDPYVRSKSVYAESFQQVRAALEPLVRLAAPSPRTS